MNLQKGREQTNFVVLGQRANVLKKDMKYLLIIYKTFSETLGSCLDQVPRCGLLGFGMSTNSAIYLNKNRNHLRPNIIRFMFKHALKMSRITPPGMSLISHHMPLRKSAFSCVLVTSQVGVST